MGEEVKLFSFWSSPYAQRITWALDLKGVEFETVNEDLPNKSSLLLQYNPIYKKVPVLLHNGRPVVESLIILEYIDETWKNNPLFPEDTYERARVRFWSKFGDDKVLLSIFGTFKKEGREQEEAYTEAIENLKILEEEMKSRGTKFFGGESGPGALDLALGWMANLVTVMEEVCGLKFLDEERFPNLVRWTNDFYEAPIIKERWQPREKLISRFHYIRQSYIGKK